MTLTPGALLLNTLPDLLKFENKIASLAGHERLEGIEEIMKRAADGLSARTGVLQKACDELTTSETGKACFWQLQLGRAFPEVTVIDNNASNVTSAGAAATPVQLHQKGGLRVDVQQLQGMCAAATAATRPLRSEPMRR